MSCVVVYRNPYKHRTEHLARVCAGNGWKMPQFKTSQIAMPTPSAANSIAAQDLLIPRALAWCPRKHVPGGTSCCDDGQLTFYVAFSDTITLYQVRVRKYKASSPTLNTLCVCVCIKTCTCVCCPSYKSVVSQLQSSNVPAPLP